LTEFVQPPDESARIEEVRSLRLLDTLPEERFDRIVKLAARIFNVPIAAICLADFNRFWFKAKIGIESSEIKREVALCGRVIGKYEPYVIEDTQGHPDLAGNTYMMGGREIRFFVSHPLLSPRGIIVATLCIQDYEPRKMGDEDLESLKMLAAVAETELGLVFTNELKQAVEQREKMIRYILDSALDSVISVDKEGMITEWNPKAEKVFGWSKEEAVGKSFINLIVPWNMKEEVNSAILCSLRSDAGEMPPRKLEMELMRRSGEQFRASAGVSVVRLEDRVHLSIFVEDVTSQKWAEEQLKMAKDAAEAGNKAKSVFIANMSHELRTPLNTIIGFANVLLMNRERHLSEKETDYLRRIQTSGMSLLELINSILDLSKIEAGRSGVEVSSFSLASLVSEVVGQMRSLVGDRAVELREDVPRDLQPLNSDAEKIRRILINLLGNAIKFTERGRVTVRIIPDHAHRPFAVEVADTGIGIPREKQGLIFEPFQQVESGMARQYGGSGLGLAISNDLAKILGARLEVDSEPGRGSVFRLVLPPREGQG